MNIIFRDAFVSVEITLLDLNDNGPTFVPNNQYNFKTRVDSTIGTTIGKVYQISNNYSIIYYNTINIIFIFA